MGPSHGSSRCSPASTAACAASAAASGALNTQKIDDLPKKKQKNPKTEFVGLRLIIEN